MKNIEPYDVTTDLTVEQGDLKVLESYNATIPAETNDSTTKTPPPPTNS